MTTAESKAPNSPSIRSRFLVSALAVLIVLLLFLLAFMLGSLVAATGLHDPDSCWLLASGKYIFEHGGLPRSDPFSYTFQSLGRPFVMYQWLTEWVFFAIFKMVGLGGLLTLAALFATMTFIALPLIASQHVPRARALVTLFVFLLVFSASFHILIRPELISYSILSLFAYLAFLWRKSMLDDANVALRECPSDAEEKNSLSELVLENGIGWKAPLAFAVLMLFWVNLHSAFTLGLIVIVFLLLGYGADIKSGGSDLARNLFAMAVGLLLSLGTTLVNPRGLGLWSYLPQLYFSSMNKYIAELKPLGFKDVFDLTYTPYFILSTLTVVLFAVAFKKARTLDLKAAGPVFSLFNIAFAVIAGISARRMIPFVAILLTYESLFLLYILSLTAKTSSKFSDRLALKLELLIKPTLPACFVTFGMASLFGSYITCQRIVPPNLPQGNSAFHVPLAAVNYLKEHPLQNNIFNDAQFGDVMIWHIGPTLPVFVDTRYDMYGDSFIRDYQRLRFAEREYPDLLKQYSIGSIFMPTDSDLVAKLSKSDEWKESFRDQTAVILTHVTAGKNE